MGFAQRIGKKPVTKNLQLESVDDELRNSLWNAYLSYVIGSFDDRDFGGMSTQLDRYIAFVWHEYLKLPIDQRHQYSGNNIQTIRKMFFSFEWYNLYDFLEFNVSQELLSNIQYHAWPFINECNRILEREFSGYRFIDSKIVPISNEIEINEITDALNAGKSFFNSTYKGVNLHLKEALGKLSDKKTPDYRNSIKESISAVEALCRQLTGKSTLGEALNNLEKDDFKINPQLKNGFEKLYAYTNNKESGIRHALIDSPQLPTFHEAKFMLVACSAFINYLISQTK